MKVHFPCITQGKGVLILVKAVETDYSRLRYQLGISMESGSNSGAERATSLSTTTIKHPQEVPITCTALMVTPQDLDVEGTDRTHTGRSVFSQLQEVLAALGTLSWQLSQKVKSHGVPTRPEAGQPWSLARKLDYQCWVMDTQCRVMDNQC